MSTTTASPSPPERILQRARQATVGFVVQPVPNQSSSLPDTPHPSIVGSGVALAENPRIILTARHVLAGGDGGCCRPPGGHRCTASSRHPLAWRLYASHGGRAANWGKFRLPCRRRGFRLPYHARTRHCDRHHTPWFSYAGRRDAISRPRSCKGGRSRGNLRLAIWYRNPKGNERTTSKLLPLGKNQHDLPSSRNESRGAQPLLHPDAR